jgi:hypothetical protein
VTEKTQSPSFTFGKMRLGQAGNIGHEKGANMRLVSGTHCFVWGSMAALLYAGAANLHRDVIHIDQDTPPSDPARAVGDLKDMPTSLDASSAFVDPVSKLASSELEVTAEPFAPSDECAVSESCINQYLWSVYERTRKVDTITVKELTRVIVKKRGHTRSVTKTTTKLEDEDFTWKDLQAAARAGMSAPDYVIGGMEGDFKMRLFHLCRALDDAGLAPGMTSGFRDDYRQSITSGNKAATDRSYHGGSRHGGFGHGLAADLVSVRGETRSERWISSESLWKWIDAHGGEFGIGRPYLDKDPPHVGPINGNEYAYHRGLNVQHAGL